MTEVGPAFRNARMRLDGLAPQLKLEIQCALQRHRNERIAKVQPSWSCRWCDSGPSAR